MASDADHSAALSERVRQAAEAETPLAIRGTASKAFYGRPCEAEPLDVRPHRGVVNYAASELVLTARAGTPLAELEALLAAHGQMFPFEPPQFGGDGTLGGAVASGLSGPRRPFTNALRDVVLGTRVLNGNGEVLRFGGEVIKNVAGYDVSRLMTGALGTLGVLLEISVKVLPRPEASRTCRLELPMDEVFGAVERWLRNGFPVSATAHDGEALHVRLSGAESAVASAARAVGGETVAEDSAYWRAVRDHMHPFFGAQDAPLWRLSLPPGRPMPALDGPRFQEWAGRQLWLRGVDADEPAVRREVHRLGGHAACFRGGARTGDVFQPPAEPLMRFHRRLKRIFDPAGILNPGRLYPNL